MPKQTVTIEVDVPEGKEIYGYEHPYLITCSETIKVKIELRDKWQWPTSLLCDWIAMDEMWQWHGYREEPREALATWSYNGPRLLLAPWFDFTPPPCTDWRQSKRRRPTF